MAVNVGAVLTYRRIVDIRVTENSGEVAKYVTKPGAYLKLDGAGAWWCDPERLETLHYALGRGASSAGRGRCLESGVSSGSWKSRTSTIWLPSTNWTTARRGRLQRCNDVSGSWIN